MADMFQNTQGDVVGMKLPNGKVQVVRSNKGSSGEVFESEEDFNKKYPNLNESSGSHVTMIESVNG